MTAKNFNKIMIGLLCLVITGSAAMLYFGNLLMSKSSGKLITSKLNNIGFDAEEQNYLQARKDLETYSSINQTLQKILPKSKDQAQAVNELYKIGDETGIMIESIQFPSSNLGSKSSTKSTGSSSSSSSSSVGAISQAKAVEGMPGVLGIDVSVSLLPTKGKSISYDSMISFLQKVEQNRRNMQIKQITVYADTINGGVTFDLTLTIFVKP